MTMQQQGTQPMDIGEADIAQGRMVEPLPMDIPGDIGMTARGVKNALLARHPAMGDFGRPGPWTCVEEWNQIDFLAFAAWTKPAPAQARHARIGYEVKVSRGDMRTELLRPAKRAVNVGLCHEFYFAVPRGLLTAEEIAFVEPDWMQDPAAYVREPCPGFYGSECREQSTGYRRRRGDRPKARGRVVRFGITSYADSVRWTGRQRFDGRYGYEVPCPTCGGCGYLSKSMAERYAPTLWIPADVGLVEVAAGTARVVRKAPVREPRDLTNAQLTDLVRWVSFRPDPRHADRNAR